MEVKPFQNPPYTMFNNAILDYIMPRVSPSAWKVLCVAIRQTVGWVDEMSLTGRRESDKISYDQFKQKTGIGGKSAIANALKELLQEGILIRSQVGKPRGSKKPSFSYQLARDYKLVVTSPEMGPVTSPETGPVTSPETGHTKETNKQTKVVVDDFQSLEQSAILSLLGDIGVLESIAQDLAGKCTLDQVKDWIRYARKNDQVKDLPAFVVSQLKIGNTVPKPPAPVRESSEDRERRYLGGKYADIYKH
jgi:hypothetical protein